MDLKLAGRTCLVTGASSGIGRAVACSLAREGMHLAIAGRDRVALDQLRQTLMQHAPEGTAEALVCIGDLSTQEGVEAVASQARDGLEHIDTLVNNAGGSRPMPKIEQESIWQEAFDLNFNAARRLTFLIAPSMVASGWGRIINVSGAVVGAKMNAALPAKAALQSWSKALASELAPHGVTVNCVAPGRINSRQICETLHPTVASREDYIAKNIPMGRFGEPEEFANVVTFLLSPLSSYVTGIVMPIDGGLHRLSL